MKNKYKLIILAFVTIAFFGIMTACFIMENYSMNDKKYAQLPISKQFKYAPEGHYVHLSKDDPTLYKTTWSQIKFTDYVVRILGNEAKLPNEKTTFGTSHTFKTTKRGTVTNSLEDLNSIYDVLNNNHFFNSNVTLDENTAFKWYFNNIESAKTDKDVAANVTHILR